MDQSDPAVFADMGVGIDIVGFSMGGPAGVSDTQHTLQIRAAVGQLIQHLQTALGLAYLQASRLRAHRNTCGIVAPVFHPGQSVQQDGRRLLTTHKSNNSTHKKGFLLYLINFKSTPRSQRAFPAVTVRFVLQLPAYLSSVLHVRRHGGASAEQFDTPLSSSSCLPAGTWRC